MKQKSSKAQLSGPDLAKLMKIGTRIVRGADWKWGDQDGNPPARVASSARWAKTGEF